MSTFFPKNRKNSLIYNIKTKKIQLFGVETTTKFIGEKKWSPWLTCVVEEKRRILCKYYMGLKQ
jgi:hypothetical protein